MLLQGKDFGEDDVTYMDERGTHCDNGSWCLESKPDRRKYEDGAVTFKICWFGDRRGLLEQ